MSLIDLLNFSDDKGLLFGVYVGVVTNNSDPEGLGRVKVKFAWRDFENESDWARVAVFMAGNERGSFFIPEVGDEVLVAFHGGDIRAPFILGSLWNKKEKPPQSNSDGNNDIRTIVSRSGHQLTLNDSDQNKGIKIATKGGNSIFISDASGKEKIEIKDKNGNQIIIDSSQNAIILQSSMDLSIKATKIDIKATGSLNISADATVEIKGALVKIN